jgi:hypothetical protein
VVLVVVVMVRQVTLVRLVIPLRQVRLREIMVGATTGTTMVLLVVVVVRQPLVRTQTLLVPTESAVMVVLEPATVFLVLLLLTLAVAVAVPK